LTDCFKNDIRLKQFSAVPLISPNKEITMSKTSKRIIFLLEDEKSVEDTYKAIFARDFPDHQVVAARSLLEARQILPSIAKSIDVACLDGRLPDGGGWEILPILQGLGFNGQAILVTGGLGSRADSASLSVINDFAAMLKKPFRISAMTAVMKSLMPERKSLVEA
jgi:DNA-binding NtrC family response regulator